MEYFFAALTVIIVLIVLDALRRINITWLVPSMAYAVALPHMVCLNVMLYDLLNISVGTVWTVCCCVLMSMCILGLLLRLSIRPIRKYETKNKRLRIMLCGRRIILLWLFSLVAQIPVEIFLFRSGVAALPVLIADLIVTIITVFVMELNGIIRILLTSLRYNAVKKLIICALMLIPFFNIFVLLWYCKSVRQEYDHEVNMLAALDQTAESDVCATKYPLILLHGVGFRDYKYINYWGRIPRELKKRGAVIFYGHQQAWTTVAESAEAIKETIERVIEETGAEKVNLIAHSKGGLDARYVVSKLGMAPYVASVTTISTPHHGTELLDVIVKTVPEKLYRFIARIYDSYYRKIGDTTPDFYTASHEFTTSYAHEFNDSVPDADGVFYQSYMTVMKNAFSDWLLMIPYIIMSASGGRNDGLVTIDSAKWGDFRGVIENTHRRGISHGDIIDLERENIPGFNVIEEYVNIVSDLKNSGY